MKRTSSILAICAAIACAIVVLFRSNPTENNARPTAVTEEPEPANTRIRPGRESGPSTGEGNPSDTAVGSPSSLNDPREALADAVSRLKEPELALALAELLGTWAKTDPLAAFAWIDSSGREDAADLRSHVIFTWAEKAPDAASSWLEENPGMQEPANLLALLGPWMDSSPEAAVAWSTTKIETIQREGILADLLASCGSEANALALLGEVDPVVADHALQAAVTSLADEEPELAEKLSALITGTVEAPDGKPGIENTSPASGAGSGEIQPTPGPKEEDRPPSRSAR